MKERKTRRPVILVLASCWLASACHAPKNSHDHNPSVVDAPTQIPAVESRKQHAATPEEVAEASSKIDGILNTMAGADWTGLALRKRMKDPPPEWKLLLRSEWDLVRTGPAGVPTLLKALEHENMQVRRLVALTLGRTASKAAVEPLSRALEVETEFSVMIALIEALALIGGEQAEKAIRKAIAVDSPPKGFWEVEREGDTWLELVGKVDRELLRAEYQRTDSRRLGMVNLGQPVPDMYVLDSSGRETRLSEYWSDSTLILIFLFADFCRYCQGQVINFRAQIKEIEKKNGRVVFVVPKVPEQVESWQAENGTKMTFLADPAGRIQALFGIARQIFIHEQWFPSPTCAIIDREGRLLDFPLGRAFDDRTSPRRALMSLELINRR